MATRRPYMGQPMSPQANDDFMRYLQQRDGGFQPYSAGNKVYGQGQSSPHRGGGLNPMGYRERDMKMKTYRNAMLKRMKAGAAKRYMSSDYMNPQGRSY